MVALTSPAGISIPTPPALIPKAVSAALCVVAPVPPFSMGSVPDIVEDVSECVWLVLAAPKFERAEDALVAPVPPFVMGSVPDIVEDVSECVWLVLAASKFASACSFVVAPVPPFIIGSVPVMPIPDS